MRIHNGDHIIRGNGDIVLVTSYIDGKDWFGIGVKIGEPYSGVKFDAVVFWNREMLACVRRRDLRRYPRQVRGMFGLFTPTIGG
jgi:hypothetical protein